jgi:hypothetical protein
VLLRSRSGALVSVRRVIAYHLVHVLIRPGRVDTDVQHEGDVHRLRQRAALTIRVPPTEFIRVLTTSGSFYPLIVDCRMTMEGDLGLANRMAEMFGGRSTY